MAEDSEAQRTARWLRASLVNKHCEISLATLNQREDPTVGVCKGDDNMWTLTTLSNTSIRRDVSILETSSPFVCLKICCLATSRSWQLQYTRLRSWRTLTTILKTPSVFVVSLHCDYKWLDRQLVLSPLYDRLAWKSNRHLEGPWRDIMEYDVEHINGSQLYTNMHQLCSYPIDKKF